MGEMGKRQAGTLVIGTQDALSGHLTACLAESRSAEPWGELPDADTWLVIGAGHQGRAGRHAPAVFQRCVNAGVRHLVLLSSTAIIEPHHRLPGHIPEDRLPRRDAQRAGHPTVRSWRELERAAENALDGTDTILTVLRPTALAIPGGRDPMSRLLSGRIAGTLPGFDPSLQILSADDLAEAVRRAIARDPIERRATATFNVAPAGVVPLRKALRIAGTLRLPLPYPLQWLARAFFWPLGLALPADHLVYLKYPWTVSGDKARRELGFEPRHTSAEAVASLRPKKSSRLATKAYDDHGMDREYVGRLGKTLFRFLHDVWWRIEVRGLGNVPPQGRAVLTGVHRGHQPWDGVMALHLLARELGRYPRFLIHPTLAKHPFLTPYINKCGGIYACRENAAWVLEQDEMVAIFPEGIRGAFRMYRDVYTLGKLGRDEFVKIALHNRAPIVPFVTVGSAEIFPIYGRIDWSWWKRYSEWPFFPITPTMSLLPLPSKWHTWFLEPIHVEEQHPPAAADDPEIVRAISQQVRERLEAAIAEMLKRRKAIFWGSIFSDQEKAWTLEETA